MNIIIVGIWYILVSFFSVVLGWLFLFKTNLALNLVQLITGVILPWMLPGEYYDVLTAWLNRFYAYTCFVRVFLVPEVILYCVDLYLKALVISMLFSIYKRYLLGTNRGLIPGPPAGGSS
ncbi:MAG TPA: hypothetical protein PLG79_07960 [Spirochaetales bacterium]|nr:hypothetical protein [Spirochaetales bacterium]